MGLSKLMLTLLLSTGVILDASAQYMVASNRFGLNVDWGTNDSNFANTAEDFKINGGNSTAFYRYTKRRILFSTGTWAPKAGKFLWTNAANMTAGVRDSLFSFLIQRAEIRLASNDTLVDTVKWAGVTSKTMAAGEKIFSDAQVDLLANTTYFFDIYIDTGAATHIAFPTGKPLFLAGEVSGESLSTNYSLGAMGTGAGSAIGGFFEPSGFFAKGWDGTPVVMVLGDSICDGQNVVANRATTRGDLGHVYEACGSATGGVWNYWPLARYQSNFQSTSTDNVGVGTSRGVIDYAADCMALLSGASKPFSLVWSEHGRNTLNSNTPLSGIQSEFNKMVDRLEARFGTVKLAQQTLTPITTPVANTFGYSEANQTTTGSWADTGGNGVLRQWNNWVIAGCGGRALGLDTASVCRGVAYDKWADGNYNATLLTAVTANNTAIITVVAVSPPPIGTTFVLEPGDATNADGQNSASIYSVGAVVSDGIGNWTCTLNGRRWGFQPDAGQPRMSRVSKAHAAGVTIVSTSAHDGTHPVDKKQQEMRDYNIGRKANIITYLAV